MRMRNKPALIFFCFLLSAAAVLSGVNIYSQLKEQQKEKEDFKAVAEIAELPMTETPAESVSDTETEPSAEPTEQSATEHNIPALIAVNGDCIGWLSIKRRIPSSGSVSRSKNDPSQSLQTMNTLTPYPTKATVRSGMPTRRKFRTASSKNIRRSGKRKRLHRATLAAAVRHSRPAQRTSRREHSPRAKSEAATPSVPHRRKKKLLPT